MNRRNLLLSGITGILALVGARIGLASPESAVKRVLRKRLPYLKMDEAGLEQFARDICTRKLVSSFRLDVIDIVGPLYTDSNPSQDGRVGSAVRHGEDRVVTQYLICSDFFINGADTERVVKYLGYINPLIACNNPFARPMMGSST